jgi:hypothetical protein
MASWRFLLFFVDPNRFYRIGRMNRHTFSTFNYGWGSLDTKLPMILFIGIQPGKNFFLRGLGVLVSGGEYLGEQFFQGLELH